MVKPKNPREINPWDFCICAGFRSAIENSKNNALDLSHYTNCTNMATHGAAHGGLIEQDPTRCSVIFPGLTCATYTKRYTNAIKNPRVNPWDFCILLQLPAIIASICRSCASFCIITR